LVWCTKTPIQLWPDAAEVGIFRMRLARTMLEFTPSPVEEELNRSVSADLMVESVER